MAFRSIWGELQDEFDNIMKSSGNKPNQAKSQTQSKPPSPKKLTADRIEQIKDEVHAEETHCWESGYIMPNENLIYEKYRHWYKDIFGEDIEATLKNADMNIKAGQAKKKQAELAKAKDSVAKKQKQLTDITKGV